MGVGDRPWKTLAIYWQRDDDNLTFVAPEGTRLAAGDTKRQMLSTAAGIFDSIGCLALFLVLAKILFQSLWETGAGWDEPLPEEVNRPWIDRKRELDDLPLVPWCLCPWTKRSKSSSTPSATRPNGHTGRWSTCGWKPRPEPLCPDCGEADPFRPKGVAARRTLPVLLERQRGHTSVGTVSGQSVEAIRPQSRQRDPTASGTGVLETLPGEEQPGRLTEPRIGPSEHNSLLPIEEARAPPPQAALLVSVVTHAQDDVLHPGRYGDIERLFRITALCLRFVHNVHGIPRGPPGARAGDVHGGSDASSSVFHSPAGSTGDNPDQQFPIFQSAASELRRLWRGIDVDQVQNELAGQRIQWHFIPPRAPWMGGYLERLIRTMKESLRKVLGQALLDDEELRTILCELLTSRTYIDLPEVDDPETNWHTPGEGPRRWESRWRYRQQLIAKWWRRWRSGYLSTLLPRRKWTSNTEGLKLNPQGGGETFPRRRRRGPLSAAPDLHGRGDQARRQTGGAGTSAR
ncbi:hypothetical protein T05_11703 [Trichinella murrelli]|uniref:DUF5641 domain-containing protein n=1 Tax=Trichinella murrelli TaxID=144512 RepID=A0A0V0T7H9_9BILA|nr:hypothetical protein T05_11703 [Trichinella murrelli]